MEAGIPCAVPVGTICPRCLPSAARLSERDLTGYTNNRVPDHIKELRARLEPREAPSAVANRSTRAGLSPAGYGGLRTPSPFPERPPLGRSVAPMSLDGEESSPTNSKTMSSRGRLRVSHDPLNYPADSTARIAQRRRWGWEDSLRMVNAMTMTIVPCTIEPLLLSSVRALR
ncbi:hypothetical protein V7S43_016843 [Phytophthora oleae]|uniref:Uncharacterized protein n=1 Tax=Phytophthora oleae TaxID=2107226 RepID=A0ABD3EUL0_9STRA